MSYRDTRQGRCYELSFLEALHGTEFGFDPDITLVHGVFLGRRHAWVVSGDDGAVCDMVTGFGWLSREAHERQGYEAKYLATYTRDEAIAKACEYGHFGPWDAENPALTEEYGDCDCAEREMLRPRGICELCERAAQFAECDAEAETRAEEVAS